MENNIITKDLINFIPIGKASDLTNQIFGRLTVLGRAPSDKEKDCRAFWWCQCECGNIIKTRTDQLTRGVAKSCGCLKKEKAKESGKLLAQKYNPINGKKNKKDLTGLRFGHLTVIKDTLKRQKVGNGTNVIWECLCDCGKITEVAAGHLQSGHTSSCGCNKQSRGEEKIAQILKENNISFEQEFWFKQVKYSSGGYPRFDFFVNNEYVIEYDGEQHFDATNHGWDNLENLKLTQQRDSEKNQICHNFNIPIIRIPYTHLKNIALKDLKLETTTFLYKE